MIHSPHVVLPAERTGWVKVSLVDGTTVTVEAESFGHAASQVYCANGRIREFQWVGKPETVKESEATIGN